ncbi:MAG: hypothetical protein IMZ53_02755 [Thermoplasmata archaeon]|nr:hypothetical protein [Thermoplasmata archaeon]MBE3139481.1 hypothetical protein [Thermoplasmata archaeon]
MKTAKLGAMFLVSLMALAGVGASYAAWTQAVDIQGSVTTGNFDFQIYNIVVNEANGATITPVIYDAHTWDVTVTGTYPGWKGWITMTNYNAGTVTLKFNTFQVTALAGEDLMCQAYTLKAYHGTYAVHDTENIWGTLWDLRTLQYYDWWVGPYEIKMAPGTYHDSLVSLELDPTLTGHYGSTVTFTFELTAIQTTPIV